MDGAHGLENVGPAQMIVLRDDDHVERRGAALGILNVDGAHLVTVLPLQCQCRDNAMSATGDHESRRLLDPQRLGPDDDPVRSRNPIEGHPLPRERQSSRLAIVRDSDGAGEAGNLAQHAGRSCAQTPAFGAVRCAILLVHSQHAGFSLGR